MKLCGAKIVPAAPVPQILVNQITQCTTCAFLPEEIQAIGWAYQALAIAAEKDPQFCKLIDAAIFFFDNDEVAITIEDAPSVRGHFLPTILIPLHRWRASQYGSKQILVIMLEELCHCFFLIRDELEVKKKVTEVFQYIRPGTNINELYRNLDGL